ncbi:MAG: hypothetical protein AAGH72_13070 [Verrucomicrobiota bacterium]
MSANGTWPKWLPWLLSGLVLLQIIVLCTSPIKDGDIFFHMVYGKTALEEKTLIADHSIYTWSPASNDTLYCNWFSQIFFYLCYTIGGFAPLFAFKYAIGLIFFGLLLHLAKLTRLLQSPMMWAIGIVCFSMAAPSGVVIKPEAFSFIAIMLFSYLWVRIRLSSGQNACYLPYCYPLIMAIWVNSHGGFIFGATFLLVMWLGEQLNVFFCPKEALSPVMRKHLLIACIFSAAALLVNPHGIAYPINIASGLLDKSTVNDFKTISDYRTVFSSEANWMNLPSFFAIALALLTLTIRDSIQSRRYNWAVILTNLVFAGIFCYMLRTAYFWSAVLAMTSLYLLKDSSSLLRPNHKLFRYSLAVAPVVFALIFSVVLFYKKTVTPGENNWFGYGMSVRNPQEEAEYIKDRLSAFKLGNDYDSGAYLMWTLYPDQKHMIDQRYFPFKSWYAEYFRAFSGKDTQRFIDQMDCDIWCIGFNHIKAINWFRNSPEWETVFYGQSAAVFGRYDHGSEPAKPLGGKTIEEITILSRAVRLLSFSVNIEDWNGAFRIYEGMANRFPDTKALADARRLLEGTLFYRAHQFSLAAERLTPSESGSIFRDDGILRNAYLHTTVDLWKHNETDTAFIYAQAAVLIAPKDLMAHYNYGMIAAFVEINGLDLQTVNEMPDWKQSLRIYVDNFQQVSNLPVHTLTSARNTLHEKSINKPSLIEPRKPDPDKISYYQNLINQLD